MEVRYGTFQSLDEVRDMVPPPEIGGTFVLAIGKGDHFEWEVIEHSDTEGNPVSKYCCRECGDCAPEGLLEEGKFLERISWLRHHYQEKHPGIWGKG